MLTLKKRHRDGKKIGDILTYLTLRITGFSRPTRPVGPGPSELVPCSRYSVLVWYVVCVVSPVFVQPSFKLVDGVSSNYRQRERVPIVDDPDAEDTTADPGGSSRLGQLPWMSSRERHLSGGE